LAILALPVVFTGILVLMFTGVIVVNLVFGGGEPGDRLAYVARCVELDLTGCAQQSYSDTHGGFHGDGEACGVFLCDADTPEQISASDGWQPCPMPEDFARHLQNHTFDADLTEALASADFWYLLDEQSEGAAHRSPDGILSGERYSHNYKVALYDTDASLLYFYELDT